MTPNLAVFSYHGQHWAARNFRYLTNQKKKQNAHPVCCEGYWLHEPPQGDMLNPRLMSDARATCSDLE